MDIKDVSQRAKWTTAQHDSLLDGIIDAINMGKVADNGYKKEAWERIKKDINEKFNMTYDISQLKTALKGLKARYQMVKKLLDQSGFGWDSSLQMVMAEPVVWLAYIASHPEAKEFHFHPFPLYDKLHRICEGRMATGEYVLQMSNMSGTLSIEVDS